MAVLTIFDPWRCKLCNCRFKYSFSPYVGCSHLCQYCYASSYISRFFESRVKMEVIKSLNREVSKIKSNFQTKIVSDR